MPQRLHEFSVYRCTIEKSRINSALVSVLVTAISLIVLEFIVAAGYFLDLVARTSLYILGISLLAGAVRSQISRRGLWYSVICGVLVAIVGYVVVLCLAISSI